MSAVAVAVLVIVAATACGKSESQKQADKYADGLCTSISNWQKLREGKNLKGRILGLVIGTIGKGKLEKAFAGSVAAIEARNDGARAADTPSTA